ncbi:hypothetical protein BCR36DRAFT_161517 [Piromyces finnis]|uniref:Uncharacterized protein n=1 Tax=Piromyces finnis TaxID=1754191 RepID=A0A1Y1VHF8_9FUNG|nr:hypothetical protein BCR36DRAFT_161517 [Piromyces finnis]|eukprot:ORX56470.1 hypothetical protein BCR36DRAFT_161517 [Piromyces finnis]
MVKNYKKKPLNVAASGYTPPPPTGTPIYQPDDEAEIPSKKANLPPRRMNPQNVRPVRPVNINSVPPVRYQQNNNIGLPNSLPANYGQQQFRPQQQQYNNPQQFNQQYNQPQYNRPQYIQPQINQPQYNQPQYRPQQYNQPQQQQFNNMPIPQRFSNSSNQQYNNYQQSPNNGPMIPPRKDRYETNYNTSGNPYYSEPTYKMPCPK